MSDFEKAGDIADRSVPARLRPAEPPAPGPLAVVADSPLPMFSGEQMADAFRAYTQLQRALDASITGGVITVDNKPFRTKAYWRAVAVAFALRVELVSEVRTVHGTFADGHENFGYAVVYRAIAPGANPRASTGDGSAFAIEKAAKFRCPHTKPGRDGGKPWAEHFPAEKCPDFDPEFRWRVLPTQSTEHNIRSHAHTRAYNRAISNLVGFGEVSAEEIDRTDDGAGRGGAFHEAAPPERQDAARAAARGRAPAPGKVGGSAPPASAPAARAGDAVVTDGQGRKLYATAMNAGWRSDELVRWLKRKYHVSSTRDLPARFFDQVLAELETPVDAESPSGDGEPIL